MLLNFRSERGQEIVRVHDDVYERVEADNERRVAVSADPMPEPTVEHDEAMMYNVEGGDLIKFLTEHEEERVQIIGDTQQSEPPIHLQQCQGLFVGGERHTLLWEIKRNET